MDAAEIGDGDLEERIQFRDIVAEDRETLYRIYASTRTEELSIVPWSDADKEKFLRMQFDAQSIHYDRYYSKASFQLILVADQVAGRLYLHRGDNHMRIVDITLLPSFRGHGVGSAILRDLIAESETTGKPISIHVEKQNRAKRLYERLGFKEVADAGGHDLMERQPAVPIRTDRKHA